MSDPGDEDDGQAKRDEAFRRFCQFHGDCCRRPSRKIFERKWAERYYQ